VGDPSAQKQSAHSRLTTFLAKTGAEADNSTPHFAQGEHKQWRVEGVRPAETVRRALEADLKTKKCQDSGDLTGCALEIRLQRRRKGSGGLSWKGRGLRGSRNLYRRASTLPGNLRHGERRRRAGAREQTAARQKFGANRGSQSHNAQAAGIARMEVDADNADRQRVQGSPSSQGIARRQNHRSGLAPCVRGNRRRHPRYARPQSKRNALRLRLLLQAQQMDQYFWVNNLARLGVWTGLSTTLNFGPASFVFFFSAKDASFGPSNFTSTPAAGRPINQRWCSCHSGFGPTFSLTCAPSGRSRV